MQANVGGFDRIARIIVGLALIVFALLAEGALRWAGLLGVVLLVTGVVRWCPLYIPFGIRTGGKG